MSNNGQPLPENLHKKEVKKRIYFIFKLLLFAVLVYIRLNYTTEIQNTLQIPEDVLDAILFYIMAHLAISLTRIVFVYFYIRSKKLKNGQDNFVLAVSRLASLLSAGALIAALFLMSDLDPGEFLTAFSLVAVATVLLIKDYVSNIVNGILIMLSERISLNDYVKIGNHDGKVVNITLGSVYLITDDDRLISIPNNTVYAADVINYSKRDTGLVEIELETKPETLHDFSDFETYLIATLQPYHASIEEGSYRLTVKKLLSDKATLRFEFVLKTPNRQMEKKIRAEVLQKTLSYLGSLNSTKV